MKEVGRGPKAASQAEQTWAAAWNPVGILKLGVPSKDSWVPKRSLMPARGSSSLKFPFPGELAAKAL